MYAYEISVPSIALGLSKINLQSIDPLGSSKEFITVINSSVNEVNKMVDTFAAELDEAISLEKLSGRMSDSMDKDSAKLKRQDKLAQLGDVKNQNTALKSRKNKKLAQLENFGNVLSAINDSHNVISAAVTNMSKRVHDLFAESEQIYKELAGLSKLTGALYRRIIEISSKLEVHYLAMFANIRNGNDLAISRLSELMGAYYALSVTIVNKYSYEDADIQATLKLDAMDINAYYKDLLNDVYDSKDSFMDFTKAWTNTAGDSLDRYLNVDRQMNAKNLISVTTLGGLIGTALGYNFARKWR